MDELKHLGPSKITMKINIHPDFVQQNVPIKTASEAEQDTLDDPYILFENMRHNKSNISYKSNTPLGRISLRENGDSFFTIVLQIINGMASLLNDDGMVVLVQKFKQDAAKNLQTELFKKFGFTRKKNAKVEDMMQRITSTNSDMALDDNIILYMAKLVDTCMVIYDDERNRKDINPDGKNFVLIHKDNHTYKRKDISIHSLADINQYLLNSQNIDIAVLDTYKIAQLRELAKFAGIAASNKGGILEQLRSKNKS